MSNLELLLIQQALNKGDFFADRGKRQRWQTNVHYTASQKTGLRMGHGIPVSDTIGRSFEDYVVKQRAWKLVW
ncbi:hypothetical protein P421_11290 [Heyndrickxia coagulans P38]|nr:hypothetical protein P421_11290 [Heyndrickxia coagulans P38]